MKNHLVLGLLVVGMVLTLASSGSAEVRLLDESEAALVRGGCEPGNHCVVQQQQQSNPGCELCALLWCTDTCWKHQDERCVSGPPDNCDGDSSYASFNETCNDCSINFWYTCPGDPLLSICEDEGDYNQGGTIYKCY